MSTELHLKLIENPLTSYKAWYEVPYPHLKILRIIRTEAVIHKKGPELKKAGKILKQDKKMILMKYRN